MFDTEILGLKFELIAYLSEHDINWFEHFSDVEADMSNREIKILITCDVESLDNLVFRQWGKSNGFQHAYFDIGTSKYIFKR